MKIVRLLAFAAGMAALPAHAQTPAETTAETQAPAAAEAEAKAPVQVKSGNLVFAADGRRIGRVDRVVTVNGAPVSVSVIYSGRIVRIPVETLSNTERGLVTTLTSKEVKAL